MLKPPIILSLNTPEALRYERENSLSVFRRYMLFQIPGWVLAALILYALHRLAGLPAWAALALMAADVVKDFALFPLLRKAYDTHTKTGIERLIGETAIVEEDLNPAGFVRLRGELWGAEISDCPDRVSSGERVRVVGSRDMTLLVARPRHVDRVFN